MPDYVPRSSGVTFTASDGARTGQFQGREATAPVPREFDAFVFSEPVKWAKIVKLSGATAD